MTRIVCVACGKKLDSHDEDCPRCAERGQTMLRGVRIVGERERAEGETIH